MIKHIVMLKLKEFDSAEEKEKHARKIKSECHGSRFKYKYQAVGI